MSPEGNVDSLFQENVRRGRRSDADRELPIVTRAIDSPVSLLLKQQLPRDIVPLASFEERSCRARAPSHSRPSYAFGPFRFEPAEHQLLRDGQPVALPPKAFDLLAALIPSAGHLVTKEDLLKQVWPDTFVEEANLSYTISLLRKALGDDESPHRYIETVPRRGYRFIGQIRISRRRRPRASPRTTR